MNVFYINPKFKSIYERLNAGGRTSKLFYFAASSTLEVVNLLQNQQILFGTWNDFLDACDADQLPDYSFIRAQLQGSSFTRRQRPVAPKRPAPRQ